MPGGIACVVAPAWANGPGTKTKRGHSSFEGIGNPILAWKVGISPDSATRMPSFSKVGRKGGWFPFLSVKSRPRVCHRCAAKQGA